MQKRCLSTQVCIIGAGPAGLLLGCLLQSVHIDCLVVERHSRQATVEQAPRAGFLEYTTTQLLKRSGLGTRMLAEGRPNGRCEFLREQVSFILDYASLCNGRSHWVYQQHNLLIDLLDAFLERGGTVIFGAQAVNLSPADQPQVLCHDVTSSEEILIECEFIAGCDGFHGVSRASIPSGELQIFERHYGFTWLALLIAAPPSSEHTIYATHAHGFAGQLPRSPTLTRFYLQLPAGSTLDSWQEEQIWSELHTRLDHEGRTLIEGPIIGRSLLEMRSSIVEPMYFRRLALLGDAAHILTPAGGKGMNLALQDAEELAGRLHAYYSGTDPCPLASYSCARQTPVWRAQEFSNWMVETLNKSASEPAESAYLHRLALARLEHLQSSSSFAQNFAENYIGIWRE